MANNGNNVISEFSSAGIALSGSSGFTVSTLGHVIGIAVDGAGNVWVASNTSNNDSIAEFVGAGVPVVTPIVANLLPPYASNHSAVNKP